MPKKVKFRRPHKVSYEGKAKGRTDLVFGDFGLQALEGAWVTNRQIEAARICLARYTKRQGKIWIRIFPHMAMTKKPLEVRMGKGKGAPDGWVAVVKNGNILFEMSDITEEQAREALRLAAHKLPIKCKIITRESGE